MDPLKLLKETKEKVAQGEARKYYRFRFAPFYGGIATADCVGCNLRCVFCWSRRVVANPEKHGKFYSPEQVASKLIKIAKKHRVNLLRISGNEPTISLEHLLGVLENLRNTGCHFILETNGLLLGAKPSFAKKLSKYDFLHVRVSIKGSTPEEFSELTRAEPRFYKLQLNALKNLLSAGVSCHPAVMTFQPENLLNLRAELLKISPKLTAQLEVEQFMPYGISKSKIKELLRKG